MKNPNGYGNITKLPGNRRKPSEMCGFDSKTYEQLLRWQVPKCHFKDIASVGDHQIQFKDGNVWTFKSVSELRYIWKQKK